jgi:HAL2 family 3'(2'),5'-bisphosphate nucleotidase
MSTSDKVSNMSSIIILKAMKLAVRKACFITQKVQGTVHVHLKSDASPVTVGDFAAQSIITRTLCEELGLNSTCLDEFRLIAEEDSTSFETEEGSKILDAVVETLNNGSKEEENGTSSTFASTSTSSSTTTNTNVLTPDIDINMTNSVTKVPYWTRSNVIDILSVGRFTSDIDSLPYFMCDPIDGTKGFINPYPSSRHGHYAIGLAFFISGRPVLSVIACPNLPTPTWTSTSPNLDIELGIHRGCLFIAEAGNGAYMESLYTTDVNNSYKDAIKLNCSLKEYIPSELVLAESFDPGHSDKEASLKVIKALGLGKGGKEDAIRIDSMSKYCLVARGDAHLYLRFPDPKRSECSWDHAMGSLLVTEAGGFVTDCFGKELDFTTGRSLSRNYGIIAACNKELHEKALQATADTRRT